jgi:hypothetical protein
MINALYVATNGIYFNDPRIIPWDELSDAKNCTNGLPAITHPPCERWGRYWSGGPSVKVKKNLGDDNQCFAHALWYVRTFGGVIEHPEASHAFRFYGLTRPKISSGWGLPDEWGGRVCCVAQGNYGHKARKLTWLYGVNINFKELDWSLPKDMMRMELGPRSKEHAKELRKSGLGKIQRLSSYERLATPEPFKELLIELVGKK